MKPAATQEKYLIVNADDLGLSEGVNAGIIEAHERGVVTSASLMVCQAGAEEAGEYARRRPALSVGLHFDLGEWELNEKGEWVSLYQPVDVSDLQAVRQEFLSQLTRFRRLMGRNPTHLDSHQHAHQRGPAMMVLRTAGRKLGVPVRHFSRSVRYSGSFYGRGQGGRPCPERIAPQGLIALLSSLGPGITEISCHPGDDEHLAPPYVLERRQEVATLTNDAVRRAIRELKLTLCSFATAPLRRPESDEPPWWTELKRAVARATG